MKKTELSVNLNPFKTGTRFCNHYFNVLAAEKQQIYEAHSAAPSAALRACRPAVFEKIVKTGSVQKTFVERWKLLSGLRLLYIQ